jgi:hypothetical protein
MVKIKIVQDFRYCEPKKAYTLLVFAQFPNQKNSLIAKRGVSHTPGLSQITFSAHPKYSSYLCKVCHPVP